MFVRKAIIDDIPTVEEIYNLLHEKEELKQTSIGWIRGVYPTKNTALDALKREDLFVLEDEGVVVGSAIINKRQLDSYKNVSWIHKVPSDNVCVLHTLTISPICSGKGYGKFFLKFYEEYALKNGCNELRIDTNEKNSIARKMYKNNGYTEVGILKTDFNGIKDIGLVLLEKYLG